MTQLTGHTCSKKMHNCMTCRCFCGVILQYFISLVLFNMFCTVFTKEIIIKVLLAKCSYRVLIYMDHGSTCCTNVIIFTYICSNLHILPPMIACLLSQRQTLIFLQLNFHIHTYQLH